jgi:GDP-L-fucose synthase
MNRYIEQLATLYFKQYGMEIGIVRPTNIYGPYDKFDDDKSNVLPALIKRALNKEKPYVVWGDGLTVRDFIYVEDFVEDLLDIFDGYCRCDPVNIGSGEQINIKDAVNIILDVCEHNVTPQYDITKPTAIPYRMVDITKLKSIFGEIKRTPFREGILKTINWYKSNCGL